ALRPHRTRGNQRTTAVAWLNRSIAGRVNDRWITLLRCEGRGGTRTNRRDQNVLAEGGPAQWDEGHRADKAPKRFTPAEPGRTRRAAPFGVPFRASQQRVAFVSSHWSRPTSIRSGSEALTGYRY